MIATGIITAMIFVMEPDGSNQTNLTNHAANDFDPVWSPDGDAIAFLSDRGNEQGDGRFVFVMKADGSGVKQLSTMPDSAYPDWSPDRQPDRLQPQWRHLRDQ